MDARYGPKGARMGDFDAADYNTRIMKGLFRAVYPVIAHEVLDRTGITRGVCVDLGGGPGMLGIRLAERSDLAVVVYDPDPGCIALARENIRAHGLVRRVRAVEGRAEDLDFADGSVDLVVSRSSIFFWSDQEQGLREVMRVLRPGGWAYIGGGLGNAEIARAIKAERARDPTIRRPSRKVSAEHFRHLLERLGIPGQVETGPAGTWIVVQREPGASSAAWGRPDAAASGVAPV
jgi:ubiquinone/menaquinone biosynthesis C-methylase UbiE